MIVTIHQPAWHVFKLFHKVLMLSKRTGKPCFEGTPLEVLPLLQDFGCPCPERHNPADFLMEISGGSEGVELLQGEKQ